MRSAFHCVFPRNHVLSSIADADRPAMERLLEPVCLSRGRVLFEPGDPIAAVYFPESCVVSLVQPYASGDNIETATVGCEGVVCLSAVFGGERAALRHTAQIGGEARRMSRPDLVLALSRYPSFRAGVHDFSSKFLDTALLSVACNRLHSVDQRLARWLLMTRDRCSADNMPLTHDILAEMLGVYRPTVTRAVMALRQAGAIETSPGEVTIRDRARLMSIACECYALAASTAPAGC